MSVGALNVSLSDGSDAYARRGRWRAEPGVEASRLRSPETILANSHRFTRRCRLKPG